MRISCQEPGRTETKRRGNVNAKCGVPLLVLEREKDSLSYKGGDNTKKPAWRSSKKVGDRGYHTSQKESL